MCSWWTLVLFWAFVLLFHASELVLVWIYNRAQFSWGSALLSPGYVAVLTLATTEFVVEARWTPWVKQPVIGAVGVALCIAGEALRKWAMVEAGTAFTHLIAETRRDGHRLSTHGIYRYVRHPGYLGWYAWAIGLELVLANPITALVSAFVGWRFLASRIPFEEALLERFFGEEYRDYRRATPTWLPGIP